MSYRIATFGAVALPDSMTSDELATARTPESIIPVLGGAYEGWGTSQRLPRRQELTVNGVYHGTAATLRTQVDALRAKLGVRDQLWRSRDDDAVLQWRYARLLKATMRGSVERWAASVAEVEAMFETAQGAWRSAAAATDNRTLAAGVAISQNVATGGNVPVSDAIITLTAGAGAAVTSFAVTCTTIGVSWTWTGTLAANKALVIDCGAMTVLNDGANGCAGFALNAGHSARGWLPLAVGDNYLTLTASAVAVFEISHYDQWA